MALVAVCTCTVVGSSRPASADSVPSARARAAALEAKITALQAQIGGLEQQWVAERAKLNYFHRKAALDRELVSRDRRAVVADNKALQTEAVIAYVTSGTEASTNPLFATDPNELGPTTVYNELAEGSLTTSVATLTNARQTLQSNEVAVHTDVVALSAAAAATHRDVDQAHALLASMHQQLAAAKADVLDQLRAAQQAADQQQAVRPTLPGQNFPAPPPNSQANIAVRAALSYLGVPYCWGGASRACVDCSGLTMLAWAAAGVDLPHYSGAQMADSTPVPLNDLMPGDLLFYGPGGSEHVAMYLGDDKMIEAPYTGAYVWVTQARFGDGFAGAGRP